MKKKENNGGNSDHYVVASRPPKGDRLQRRRSCQFPLQLHLKYFLTLTDTLLSTLFVGVKYSTKFLYERLKQHQKQGFVEEIRDFCFSKRISNNDYFQLSPCSNLTDFHNPDTVSLSYRVSQKK